MTDAAIPYLMPKDSAGNEYEQVPIPGGSVRLTYIGKGWVGGPSVRIQIWDEQAKELRQGPEIPTSKIGDTVGAIVTLLSKPRT